MTFKLEYAISVLDDEYGDAALVMSIAFINQVEALREKKLTIEEVDQVIAEAPRIINVIQE